MKIKLSIKTDMKITYIVEIFDEFDLFKLNEHLQFLFIHISFHFTEPCLFFPELLHLLLDDPLSLLVSK